MLAMPFRRRTLRRTIAVAVVMVALLAVTASAALVGLTAAIHRVSQRRADAVEAVRTAEELQRDLLLHDRVTDRPLRSQIGATLADRLDGMRETARSGAQRDALAAAASKVAAYLAADERTDRRPDDVASRHGEAFSALGTLVWLNLQEDRSARASLERYDTIASGIGVAVAAIVTLAAVLVVWWLNARALRPLSDLARVMRRFGHGDVDVRAKDDGPTEVAEMATHFNEIASALARQRRERHTFVAGIAHDLRNPISVLRMSTELAGAEPLDAARASRMIAAVRRQADRLERMVEDLLDSSSLEAGSIRLRVGTHDVRSVAADVVQHYRSRAPAHTFDLRMPDEPILVECDAMRIEQVLSNLVSNAVKYSPRGGRVTVEVEENDEIVFRVTDEGIGMTPEDAERAFEPFRRSPELRDQVAGSGLGLFVVRRLVEAHGGRIDVETAKGRGSTFIVRLPKTASAAPASDRRGVPTRELSGGAGRSV
jgi:signal transduction histidine kinase